MPSVRDSLKGGSPKEASAALQQRLEGESSLEVPAKPQNDQAEDIAEPSMAELIADRLRLAADQRAALAQNEINRLQNHIQQVQERMQELRKQNLPVAELHANLEEAENRLEEAQADLVRAKESRRNTDLTASLSQGSHEAHTHQEHEGHGTGLNKVRDMLGKTTAAPKVGRGPSHKL